MRLPGDGKAAHIQRLRVHLAIYRHLTQLAKRGGIDVLRGEGGFRRIPSVTRIVVVIRGYVHSRSCAHRERQGGGVAE